MPLIDLSTRTNYKKSTLMFDEKFDTALNLEPLVALKSFCGKSSLSPDSVIPGIPKKTIKIMSNYPAFCNRITGCKISPLLPAVILNFALSEQQMTCHLSHKEFSYFMNTSLQAAIESFHLQLDHILESQPMMASKLLKIGLEVWNDKVHSIPSSIVRIWKVYEDLNKVLNKVKDLSISGVNSWLTMGEYKSMYCPSIGAKVAIMGDVMIWSLLGVDWIITTAYFLEIFNKVGETGTNLLHTYLCTGTSMPDSHLDNVEAFLRHIFGRYKVFYEGSMTNISKENRYFTYLKAIEGLGVSEMIKRGDQALKWINLTLQDALWNALYQDEIISEVKFEHSELSDIFSVMKVPEIANVLGMVKLGGHPSIEINKGLDKLYERTHNNIVIDEGVRLSCQGVMIRDFVRNYYNIRKRLPPILNPKVNPRILKLCTRYKQHSKDGLVFIDNVVGLHDWAEVILGKCAEFDLVENQLALLKDKSLGHPRSKVMKMFIELESTESEAYSARMESKKALLEYLLDENFETAFKEYFKEYSFGEWGPLVLDYLVIKLTAKELEFKSEGRLFGASPGPERNRRIVQELNVFSFMDRYVQEQLLTPDELTILKKLVAFRNMKHVYQNHNVINISFDFSKWNNNMRKESVDPTASALLGRYYDTKVYDHTMSAFEHMLVYYADANNQRFWDGQLGGVEGLNQATWSIVFIGGIKYALEQTGYRSSVTVKGDDVRAAILVPKHKVLEIGLDTIRDQIMSNLKALCHAMGWQLNPQESFVSLSLISTSKQYLFNDTWLPISSKKVMKMESHSNIIFPNLEDIIASVFSIAHSTCSQSTSIFPAFLCANILSSRLVTRHYITTRTQTHTMHEDIVCLLLWPQVLGGPGPLPLQTFIVRGENDMLSVSISMLRHIMLTSTNLNLREKTRRILSQRLKETPNLRLLLGDPYSVDLDNLPIRPSSIIKETIRRSLDKFCKNPHIKRLLSIESREAEDHLVQILNSMEPYINKVATSIWESSPFYVIEELLAKFMQSSTILSFISKSRVKSMFSKSSSQLLTKVSNAASNRWIYWVTTLNRDVGEYDNLLGVPAIHWFDRSMCTTALVKRVRRVAWGKDCVGITYPSLVNQFQLYTDYDITNLLYSYRSAVSRSYSITTYFGTPYLTYETDWISDHYASVKGIQPWLGSRTSTGLKFPELSTNIQSPVVRKMMKLLGLWKTVQDLSPPLISLIQSILRAYTSLDLSALQRLQPNEGKGHIAHRVQINSFSMVTAPNNRPNIGQCVSVSKMNDYDTLRSMQRVTVNEAARVFYSIFLATFPLQSTVLAPKILQDLSLYVLPHLVVTTDNESKSSLIICPDCIEDCDDPLITLSDQRPLDLSFLLGVPLISCSGSEVKMIVQNINHTISKEAKSLIHHVTGTASELLNYQAAVRCLLRRLKWEHNFYTDISTKWEVGMSSVGSYNDDVKEVLCPSNLSKDKVGGLTWIACKPQPLYEALYSEVLYHLAIQAGRYIMRFREIGLLLLAENMYSELIPMFSTLCRAGVLDRVSLGCKLAGIIPQPLTWDHGSNIDAVIATQCFIRNHATIFMGKLLKANELMNPPPISGYTYEEISFQLLKTQEKVYQTISYIVLIILPNQESPLYHTTTLYEFIAAIVADYANSNLIWDETIEDDLSLMYPHNYVSALFAIISMEHLIHQLDITPEDVKLYLDRGEYSIPLSDISHDVHDFESIPFITDDAILELEWPRLIINKADIHKNGRIMSRFRQAVINLFQKSINNHASRFDSYLYLWDSILTFGNRVMTRNVLIENIEFLKDTIFQMRDMDDPTWVSLNPDVNLTHKYTPVVHSSGPSPCILDNNHTQVGKILSLWDKTIKYPDNLIHVIYRLVALSRRIDSKFTYLLDPYNLTRIYGGLNHSMFRYAEVLNKLGLLGNPLYCKFAFTAIIIGDGAGSVTRFMLNEFPLVHVVMSTLQRSQDGAIPLDSHLEGAPLELIDMTTDSLKSSRLFCDKMYPGNFLLKSVRDKIKVITSQIPYICKMLISDADIFHPANSDATREDRIKYLLEFIRFGISTLTNGGCLILRYHLIDDITEMKLICCILSMFDHAHLYRPRYIRYDSNELFLVILLTLSDIDRLDHVMAPDFEIGEFNFIFHPPSVTNSITALSEAISATTSMMEHNSIPIDYLPNKLMKHMTHHISTLMTISESQFVGVGFDRVHLCDVHNDLIRKLVQARKSTREKFFSSVRSITPHLTTIQLSDQLKLSNEIVIILEQSLYLLVLTHLQNETNLTVNSLSSALIKEISFVNNTLQTQVITYYPHKYYCMLSSIDITGVPRRISLKPHIKRAISIPIRWISHSIHSWLELLGDDPPSQITRDRVSQSYDVRQCCINGNKARLNQMLLGAWLN